MHVRSVTHGPLIEDTHSSTHYIIIAPCYWSGCQDLNKSESCLEKTCLSDCSYMYMSIFFCISKIPCWDLEPSYGQNIFYEDKSKGSHIIKMIPCQYKTYMHSYEGYSIASDRYFGGILCYSVIISESSYLNKIESTLYYK